MYPDFDVQIHDRCHDDTFIFADSRNTDPAGVIVKALRVRCDGSFLTMSLDDTFDAASDPTHESSDSSSLNDVEVL